MIERQEILEQLRNLSREGKDDFKYRVEEGDTYYDLINGYGSEYYEEGSALGLAITQLIELDEALSTFSREHEYEELED